MERKYYSQNGEDILLWEFFGNTSDGIYVDVGAFDGIHLSNTYSFERAGWKGICIEAHPTYFPICQANRPGAACIHSACVGPDAPSSISFQAEELGLLSGIGASKTAGMEQRYERRGMTFDGFSQVQVPTVTVDAALARHFPHADRIDLLSVDVEGAEADVLAGLTVPVRLVVVEAHNDEAARQLTRIMAAKGYFLSRHLSENLFFAHNREDAQRLRDMQAQGRTEITLHPLGEKATLDRQVGKVVTILPATHQEMPAGVQAVAPGKNTAAGQAAPAPQPQYETAAPRVLFSCVVDKAPSFAQQAWFWASSLIDYAGISPEDIIVHTLPGVGEKLSLALRARGVRTVPILPFGDGAYCNKIAQLASPALADADHVILMDTDTLVLEDIRDLVDSDAIRAKVVDTSNPPLDVLKRIFKESGLHGFPSLVPVDTQEGVMTLEGYCNGGLYCIPRKYRDVLLPVWSKWALWMLDRLHLLEPQHRMHADQISFCLALSELCIPLKPLERRFNFPSHLAVLPKRGKPAVLHYHKGIERDGRITATGNADAEYKQALDKANTLINAYMKMQFAAPAGSEAASPLGLISGPAPLRIIRDANIASLTRGHVQGPRVIIHMGTPKTGTTALQSFFANNSEDLRAAGIDYLTDFVETDGDRKHQRIFQGMSQNNFMLLEQVKNHIITKSSQGIHTFVISTEGFYNYIQECGPSYMESVRELTRTCNVHVAVFLRPQDHYLESYYRQCLRNPKVADRPAYAADRDIRGFAALPWMANQLDYAANLRFLMENMGDASLDLVLYSRKAMQSFLDMLGVPTDVAKRLDAIVAKPTLNRSACEMLRILNPHLAPKVRERLIEELEHFATCSSVTQDQQFTSPTFAREIMQRHEEENRWIGMTFWGRITLFPTSSPEPEGTWTEPDLGAAPLSDLLSGLLNRILA